MSGERDLDRLLRTMSPQLQDGVFVFCALPSDADIPSALAPRLWFREREGLTLVVLREEAERVGLPAQFASRLITLDVHSALDAVGFLMLWDSSLPSPPAWRRPASAPTPSRPSITTICSCRRPAPRRHCIFCRRCPRRRAPAEWAVRVVPLRKRSSRGRRKIFPGRLSIRSAPVRLGDITDGEPA